MKPKAKAQPEGLKGKAKKDRPIPNPRKKPKRKPHSMRSALTEMEDLYDE